MGYDLVIKNGMVVDGSGLPGYRTDVGIRGGRIVEMGRIEGGGAATLDAEGKVVAPGFIDIHTHYDAQVLWDPLLTSSPWHGVTTVIMGNCGFSLAPCLPRDRDYITHMFALVEGMNVTALRHGLDWRWQSFGEYLDSIQAREIGINVAAMVGHSSVRRFVLGEEASLRQATDAEIQQMKSLVRDAMASGAFGFTTSYQPTHYGGDGLPVPSRLATHDEVLELGSTLSEFRVGSIEIITETAVMGRDGLNPPDQRLITELSLRSRRPVNWNELHQAWDKPEAWKNSLDYMSRASKEGAQVYAVARCQPLEVLFTFKGLTGSGNRSFEKWPGWKNVLSQPYEARVRSLADREVRSLLKSEADEQDSVAPEWNRLGRLAFMRSKRGKYRAFEGMSLAEISAKTGLHVVDILLGWSLDEDLEAEFAVVGIRNGDIEAVRQILQSPHSVAGISDAGAHTDMLSGANYPTYLLRHWVKEVGLISLEDAVRRLTFVPASIYGMRDRGLLREGMAADVVVFDLNRVNGLPAERFDDFPGGTSRFGNRAEGIDYLIVNGRIAFEGGRHTGNLPGALLKSTVYSA